MAKSAAVASACPAGGQGNQSGGEVELSDKLAAVELTKFMVGLRADRMTDQDIFALYRECLRVIGESDTVAPAETDPQKIATALMAILNAEKPRRRQRLSPRPAHHEIGIPLPAFGTAQQPQSGRACWSRAAQPGCNLRA